MRTPMVDFDPAIQARLGPSDLSKLLGVSRVTCSSWLNGHAQPHNLLTDRVAALLDNITQALEAGDLPVPYKIPRRERGLYIETVLAKAHRVDADAEATGA